MKTSSPLPGSSGGNAKTLAQVLAAGQMPLPAAMRYATEIASALREIHEQGRAHGRVTAGSVLLGHQGVQLLAARAWDQGDVARDTREFGALLYYLLTGDTLRPGDAFTPARRPGPRNSPSGLRASALQVAADCFKPGDLQPSMQQVLTELRLLAVLLRMPENGEAAEARFPAPQAPAPFLVAPIHFPLKQRGGKTPEPVPVPDAAPAEPVPDPQSLPSESGTAPLAPAAFGKPGAKAPAEVSPRGGPCPKCDSPTVYVARARSRFEQWLTRIRIPICRCHSCYHRYFLFSRFKIAKQMPAGAGRKKRPHLRKRD